MANDLVITTNVRTLIETIKNEIISGKKNIENTIEREKTKTYWNIGKHIYEHLLDYSDRADYGDYLFKTLSTQLAMRARVLYTAVQFYETYPKILPARALLTWSHYRVLITVDDENKRKEYERKILEENLSTRELQELINKEKKDTNDNKATKLTVTRGIPGIYRLKAFEEDIESLDIDLGFRMYVDQLDNKETYVKDSIIRVKEKRDGYSIIIVHDILLHSLYTYKGTVKEVVDGDTLWIYLYLGFKTKTCQKLRLRGINAPDIKTRVGQKAKKFI